MLDSQIKHAAKLNSGFILKEKPKLNIYSYKKMNPPYFFRWEPNFTI